MTYRDTLPNESPDLRPLALRIRRNLGGIVHGVPPADLAIRRAAVSVILLATDTGPGFVLIKRAHRGRNAGQWALPGGKNEPNETLVETALREANEEVGLPLHQVEVVGALEDFPAASGFSISPFVLAVHGTWTPQATSAEVASVHVIPIDRLSEADVVGWHVDSTGRFLQMRLAPHALVHAPTGAILLQFFEAGLCGRHVAVRHLAQPGFTHT